MRLDGYDTGGFYDEMFDASGRPRPEAQLLLDTIGGLGEGQLQRCQQAAERVLVQLGITFNATRPARSVPSRIIKDGVVPAEVVHSAAFYRVDRARVRAGSPKRFEPAPAIAVALAHTTDRGKTNDAHQWLVPVTLVEE